MSLCVKVCVVGNTVCVFAPTSSWAFLVTVISLALRSQYVARPNFRKQILVPFFHFLLYGKLAVRVTHSVGGAFVCQKCFLASSFFRGLFTENTVQSRTRPCQTILWKKETRPTRFFKRLSLAK